jgi:hypothetical protein
VPTFPRLKTGVIAQYPSTRQLRLASESLRFLDNSEQRYRDSAVARRRWVIELDLLSPTEAAVLREFFVAMRGSAGRFDFEDPWTGLLVSDCRFGTDELDLSTHAEHDARTVVTVWET